MNYRQAAFAGVTAALLLGVSGINAVRADIPGWFWGQLFTWADGVTAEVDVAKADVAALSTQVAALQAQVTTMDAYIQDLEAYVSVDDVTDPLRPVVIVSGANLQVNNGAGNSDTTNGLGNILVGYDETMTGVCTIMVDAPLITDPADCTGGFWLPVAAVKTGSHNVVVGPRHTYQSHSALVAGTTNFSRAVGASVTGGYYNYADANWATVAGGGLNTAAAYGSSITGGSTNVIDAGANHAAISGGTSGNIEVGGINASLSGGSGRTVVGASDWEAGSLFEDF